MTKAKVNTWALKFRSDDLKPLSTLWGVSGIEAIRTSDSVWLRGSDPDDSTRRLLGTIANEGRFEVLPDGALLQAGHRIPSGYAPDGNWQPLRRFLSIALPTASLAARVPGTVEIRLVPSDVYNQPNVLVTDLQSWYEYGCRIPQIRLKHCQFAVSVDGRALIHGSPLPPLEGTRAVESSGLIVPCGWRFDPGIEEGIIAHAWRLAKGEMWLVWPGNSPEYITADQFVVANHSSIRSTWELFQNGRTV